MTARSGLLSSRIGFDLRVPPDANRWDDERRARFLIRPEIRVPLSVDTSVWPSVLEADDTQPLGLRSSVDTILRDARSKGIPEGAGHLIAVDVYYSPDDAANWQMFDATPSTPAKGYADLGFDIADRYLLSGLSNCALSREELQTLRNCWAPALNERGLVRSFADACLLRTVWDKLVPEHAPFFVFRMAWMLRKENSD